MNRKNLFLLLLVCGSLLPASAQTLFTYGPYKAEAKDFLRAFNKNNSNGSMIAAAAVLDVPRSFTVQTSLGQLVPLNSEEIAQQKLTDRGKPYVMAVLDDVVTSLIL